MDGRISSSLRLRAVFLVVAIWGFGLGMVPAWAVAVDDTGTISGSFFANDLQAPMQGGANAVQTGALPQAGEGICETAVAGASAGRQLPPGLLKAIALVESGRLDPRTGMTTPWPWTIDANGTGYMYDSEQSAIQAAAAFQAAGVTSLDIGCLQVNLAQHPDAFRTLAQAFDPAANAAYAADFLTSLEQKFGNWPQAVAAYHSQTPSLGQPYAQKVYAAWEGAGPPGAGSPIAGTSVAEPMAAAMITPMARAMPLAFDPSSLALPPATLLRSGRPMNNRGLTSYRAAPVAIATRLGPQG